MADILARYEGINDTCTALATQAGIFVDEIYRLLYEVEELLDDGLYMEQASPALKTAYEQFSQTMQGAAGNINGYANWFISIKDALENNDGALFAATLSNMDGEDEGYEVEHDEVESDLQEPPDWEPPEGDIGSDVQWNDDRTRVVSVDGN